MNFRPASAWLALFFGMSAAQAAPWKSERSTEMRYQHLRLVSEDQDFKREEPVASLGARYRLLGEGMSSQWRHEIGLDLGKSLKSKTNYQIASLRSSLVLPSPRSTQTLSLGLQHARGSDPINQPVELVAADPEPSPFTSVQLSFTHQHDFNVRHAFSFELGLSHNQQDDFSLQSEDLELAYTYRSSRLSSTKFRIRQSEQQGKDTEPYHQTELGIDQLVNLSPSLSLDGSVGYGVRRQGEQRGEGLLYLGALSYSSEHGGEEENAEQDGLKPKKKKKDRPDIKDNRGLRGASVFRIGMSRSRDQRRAGDPLFVADQIFGSWGLSINQNHGLMLNLRQTKSRDDIVRSEPGVAVPEAEPDAAPEATLEARGPLKENAADFSYRWNHELGSDRRPMGGVWGLEASAQITEDGPQRYRRQVYSMLYGLVF